jgi:hypothetical protein
VAALLDPGAEPGLLELGVAEPGGVQPPTVIVRRTYLIVTIDGVVAANVLAATCKYGFAQGASEATLYCQDLPADADGNVLGSADGYGSLVEIQIGSDYTWPDPTTIPVCFRGYIRSFQTTAYPKQTVVGCRGPLYRLEEFEPNEENVAADGSKPGIDFEDLVGVGYGSFAGATLKTITTAVLDTVGGTGYSADNLGDPAHLYGWTKDAGPENFTWKTGTTALAYLNTIYAASEGWRLFDSADATIYLAQIRGRPQGGVFDIGLVEGVDILNSGSGDRTIESAKNQVLVEGYDDGSGPATSGVVNFPNQWQPDPAGDPKTYRHNNNLIEHDEFATAMAAYWGEEVSRESVKVSIPTWRDDIVGPAGTAYIDAVARLGIGDAAFIQTVVRAFSAAGAITQTITVITGGNFWFGPSVPS